MTARNTASLTELSEAEAAALRTLLEDRRRGPFISMKESETRTKQMIAARRTGLRKDESSV